MVIGNDKGVELMTPGSEAVDLPAYLDRIGVRRRPPSLEGLGELQTAHARTFAFDNVDVLLGRHPGITLAAIQEKFVGRGRGGYCFEHATLFGAVLAALGYDVEPRLGRVGDVQLKARTHLSLVVTIKDRRYLSDPGIAIPPLRPIPLEDRAELPGGIWRHRVRRVSDGPGVAWELWRRRSTGWELMHTVDPLPVRPVDVEMGHHFTSTYPTSIFRTDLLVSRHSVAPDGTPTLQTVTLDGVVSRRAGSPARRRRLELAELPQLLDSLGTNLSPAETGLLVDRLRELGAQGDD